MAARTPIVKTVQLNGRECAVHACPWPLYRKIYGSASQERAAQDVIEEVVRECVVPVDAPQPRKRRWWSSGGSADEFDVIGTSSRAQIYRLFNLAISDEEKPDF